MSKPEIKVTVSGKAGVGKSTLIKLIKIALDKKGIACVIDPNEGEDVLQAHIDNGDYSQRVHMLNEVTVRIKHKTKVKERKPKTPPPSPPSVAPR